MDRPAMRERVSSAKVGRLATVSPDGKPHVVPCCFVLDDDQIYSPIEDVKPKSTMELRRLKNLRANPAAALLVDHYEDDWSRLWWVRLDGRGAVLEGSRERERAIVALADKYEQYRQRRPGGPVLVVEVERWRSWP